MKTLGLIVSVCALFGFGIDRAGAEVTIDGTSVTMLVIEPALNNDGSPLTDLAETVGYYQIGNGPQVVCGRAPASRPSGGNEVTMACIVPVAQNQEADVRFRAQAFDLVGNPSPMTPDVIRRIDHLPPGAPSL